MKNINIKKTNKLKISITVLSLLLCMSLFAQRTGGRQGGQGGQKGGGKPDASQILSKLDTNNDQKIDIDEASKDQRGKIAQDFDSIDTNDDRFIDLTELEASLNGRKGPKGQSAEKIMKQVDDNKDGKLNALEIAAKEQLLLKNNFDAIDANDDSEIDLKELKNFLSKSENKKPKKGKKRQ